MVSVPTHPFLPLGGKCIVVYVTSRLCFPGFAISWSFLRLLHILGLGVWDIGCCRTILRLGEVKVQSNAF